MTSAAASPLSQLSEKEYKRRIRAWTLYDWANSAFSTTIMAAVLPVYYSSVAGATLASEAKATQYWAVGLSLSVFVIAILSPILGTISDIMRGKKKFLAFFMGMGVVGTGLLVLVNTGDWFLASLFFVFGRIGNGAANVFYDSLLPHVAKEEDQDSVSSRGFALGYLGGGLLLAINVAMIQFWPEDNLGTRLSFLSVAIWWAVFSIPILRDVPEPPTATKALGPDESLMRVSFGQIRQTFGEIRHYGELFRFLIAYLIYNDGIGSIQGIAAVYGAELGFGTLELVLALMLVQFAGIPFSLIFGNLPSSGDKRQPLFLAFVLFNIVMLPLAGIGGRFLLPNAITGNPSPRFVATQTAVGQGVHDLVTTGAQDGLWETSEISGAARGQTCAWYAFWCDPAQYDVAYTTTADPAARIDVPFNGQAVEIIYSTGPDYGIWAVAIDGEPLLDEAGEPIEIDGYNPTVRFDVTASFQAETEGVHTLSIINTGRQNPDSSGNVLSVAQLEVLPPLRSSNLGAILGILFGLQGAGVLFSFLFGRRFFSGLAERLDTKRSILIAVGTYALIAIWGFALNSVIEFWFLAWMVAVVQGGSQALSRSLYASLSPPSMSGEFFGLFSIMSKFASFLSPMFFIVAVALFDSSRPGILSVIIFFIIGGYLLSRVDVAEGRRLALQKEAELQAAANKG